MSRPLHDVRVLELTTAVAGPVAGAVLADMGADVIKVEQPRARTAHTLAPSPVDGAPDRPYNRIAFFNELHRGKRLLALDLARPQGREVLLGLAAHSDVVIENFSPRVVGNLGIDYADVRKARPDIVYVSMPAFGKSGPYAERGSYGPGIDAMSGLSHLTGYPDRGPGKPAQFYCDQSAGLTAALTTMAALRHRRRTGEGQYIELSMLEGELQLVAPALMEVEMTGRVPARIGNRHAWMAPHGVYRCRGDDAWVALAVEDTAMFAALCGAIGRPEVARDPRFATAEGRRAAHDELDTLIERWTRERTHHRAQEELQAAGVAAGAVLDVAEVHRDRQLRHRESFAYASHPEMGPFPHTRTAWRSRRGNHGVAGPGPTYGDGTEHALRGVLGLPPARVDELVDSGVVALEPRGGRG